VSKAITVVSFEVVIFEMGASRLFSLEIISERIKNLLFSPAAEPVLLRRRL
jgi:hypothetical protein